MNGDRCVFLQRDFFHIPLLSPENPVFVLMRMISEDYIKQTLVVKYFILIDGGQIV